MPIFWTNNPEADRLLETDGLALLIGLVLDQQVPMEKAFSGPFVLKQRLGKLNAKQIAAMDPAELDKVFRERPALHRFPGSMAQRTQDLAKVLVEEYGGRAENVWNDAKDGKELATRIKKLPGFGDMKVKITVSILAKKWGVQPKGWEDEAAHWHTVADVDSAETMAQAREIKRAMKASAKH